MDTVKIEIEIPLHHAKVWRTMCSMGRWCDAISRLFSKLADAIPEDSWTEELFEEFAYIEDNIAQMKPVIEAIHFAMRDKLIAAGVEKAWRNGTEG